MGSTAKVAMTSIITCLTEAAHIFGWPHSKFLKERGATQRFMPVWTQEEIDVCRCEGLAITNALLVSYIYASS